MKPKLTTVFELDALDLADFVAEKLAMDVDSVREVLCSETANDTAIHFHLKPDSWHDDDETAVRVAILEEYPELADVTVINLWVCW